RDGSDEMAAGFAKSFLQQETILFEPLRAVAPLRRDYYIRRQQPRFNGRTNTLSALRIGDSGRVSNQKNTCAGDVPRRLAKEKIGVCQRVRRRVERKLPGASEVFQKYASVARKAAAVQSPESDVHHIVFPETPTVALQIAAEIEYGNLAA